MNPYHKHARLGREGDKLPWGNRLFGQGTDIPGYEIVDPRETMTAALVADGSIVLEEPPALAVEPRPEAAEHDHAAAHEPEHEPEHAPEGAADR